MSCRTGHQDERGHLWEAKHAAPIYDLIGSEIEFYDLLRSYDADTVTFGDQKFAWTSWGDVLKPNKDTKTWGVYTGDFYAGKPAVTFNQLGKGSVTYVGVDSHEGDLEYAVLEKLYNQLGIEIENYPEGVLVEYRDGFEMALNYSDEEYTMELSPEAEILIGDQRIPTAGVLVWKRK